MIVFYILLLLIILSGIHLKEKVDTTKALSPAQTNVIKGIFIILVFLSHIQPYMFEYGYIPHRIEKPFLSMFNIGQSVVIMFLFYSGYGIHQQILTRGNDYVKGIPRHRILNTLLNFDVAVLVFLVLALVLKTPLTLGRIFLAFTGWESWGNSNWYIFDILIFYGIVWLTHIAIRKTSLQWLAFTGLALVFTMIMFLTRPDYWSDTILCFWGGYSLSCFKERVQNKIERHWVGMLVLCIVSFVLFHCCLLACWHLHHGGFIPAWMKLPWLWLNLKHLSVAFGIILLTMRIGCKSKPLEWCGQRLFPIYIYQRLPMMAIPSSFIAFCPIGYVASCLVVTLCIATFYKYWQIKL